MNREIKFRAKCKDNGDWVYGSYIQSYNNNDWIVQGGDFFAVDSNTVGQFTGFCDKDGKEIYEGDRLYDVFSSAKYLVYHNYYLSSFNFMCLNSHSINLTISQSWCDIVTYYKVCGNIYDNPEILEK